LAKNASFMAVVQPAQNELLIYDCSAVGKDGPPSGAGDAQKLKCIARLKPEMKEQSTTDRKKNE